MQVRAVGRALPRRGARLAAVGALLISGLAGTGYAEGPSSGVKVVRSFAAGPASGLFVDSAAGIVFDVDPQLGIMAAGNRGVRKNGTPTATNGAGIRFLDALTFDFLGPDDLALTIPPSSIASSGIAAAVDEVNHLFFYAAGGGAGGAPRIVVVDARRRHVVKTIDDVAPPGYSIAALAMGPDNRLWAQVATRVADAKTPGIVELDPLAALRGNGPAVVGSYFLWQPCPALANGDAFGVSQSSAYLVCTGVDQQILHQPASSQGVYAIPLAAGRLPSQATPARFFPVPGSFLHGWGLFDAESERLVLMTRPFGPSGAFVFDGRHQAMTGLIGQRGNVHGGCVDRPSGRFYTYTDASLGSSNDWGLLIGEARATPAPQGYAFGEFAPGAVRGVVSCDPVRRHVFVKKLTGGKYSYQVLRDDIPRYDPPPPPPNPDDNTSDTPEDGPGVDIGYQTAGRAFGARTVLVGGYSNLVYNFVNTPGTDEATRNPPPACPPGATGISCGSVKSNIAPSSRELVFGAVGDPGEAASVGVSNFSVTAVAEGAARDSSTENDMARTAGGPAEQRWPYAQAFCSSAPGRGAQSAQKTGAKALCDPDRTEGPAASGAATSDGALSLPAGQEGAPGGLPITIGMTKATAEVSSKVDPQLGAVTSSTAKVRAVRLEVAGTVIELENVAAVAEVAAKGYTGTASSRYDRSIGKLTVNGTKVCGPCVPESVVDFLNSLPIGTLRASLPKYDAEAFKPTPRGYQAAVIRDRWEQLTDGVLNERSAYDVQVPALRIAIQEDSFQHSAVLVDLAAPQAEAHRGIKPCAFCGPYDDDATTPDVLAGLGGAGGSDSFPGFTASVSPMPTAAETVYVQRTTSRPDRRSPLQQIVDGLRVVFTSPAKLGGVLLVWSILACPVYLASRRRLVLQRMQ